ncbi:MAG: S1 RNA-binding domain-containing protein [Spirochaetaceae bacterium]|nr:S1 RNA-binding domain-containing protein [Spirochaetaceae bacterium]
MKKIEIGQEIETTIVAINKEWIFLDLSTKTEGVLNAAELLDTDGNLTVQEGDSIKVFFVGEKNGEMIFTTKIKTEGKDTSSLENAYKNRIPVEGKVEKEIKGGFEIKFGSIRAFCPYSQMGFKQKEEPVFYVGKNITFRITEFKENGKNILVSNRIIEEEKYLAQKEALKATIKEGMTIKVVVESLQSYGAFVSYNGLQALLPISEIAQDRIQDISQVLTVGQELEVMVLKTDWKNERISVSKKALLDNPWDSALEKFPVGSKHTGKISRIMDFGLFIQLDSGIDGLLHISEIEDADRSTNLRKKYKIGDDFSVIIKENHPDQNRIGLQPATSKEQDDSAYQYLQNQDDNDTYNPFAALLKK